MLPVGAINDDEVHREARSPSHILYEDFMLILWENKRRKEDEGWMSFKKLTAIGYVGMNL